MSVSSENSRLRKLRRTRLSLLSDWYGEDYAAAEIAAHISQPRSLRNGIRAVMAQLETPEMRALRSLREKWPEVAGAWMSRMTFPGEWRDGILILEVRHSALLRELQPSLELLREEISGRFDCSCREIRLSISGGGAASKNGNAG